MTKIIKRLKFLNLINIIVNGRSLNFGFFNLLYGFGIIILLLKEENKLFILLIWCVNKLLNGSNPILKNFSKKIKRKKDYLLILINLKIRFTLFLIQLIIKSI